MPLHRLLADLPADLELPCGLREASLVPRVTTLYRRQAWISDRDGLRVTFDSDLVGSSPIVVASAPERFAPANAIDFGRDRIVEVKAAGATPAWLERALSGMAASSGFSKFRWGIAALYPVDEEPGACSAAS